jgi:hypothetical protein
MVKAAFHPGQRQTISVVLWITSCAMFIRRLMPDVEEPVQSWQV